MAVPVGGADPKVPLGKGTPLTGKEKERKLTLAPEEMIEEEELRTGVAMTGARLGENTTVVAGKRRRRHEKD